MAGHAAVTGPRGGRGRAGPLATALCVVLVATVAFVVAGPVAPAAAAPNLTVSPSTALAAGHPVTVSGTGLAPSRIHFVLQCGEEVCQRVTSPPPNVFVAPNSTIATSTASGGLVVQMQVERTFEAGGQTVDCTLEACRIDVLEWPGSGQPSTVGSVGLGFTASGEYQWPPSTLTLSRTTDLVGGQWVDASGSGYDWWNGTVYWGHGGTGTAAVEMCRAVPDPTPADCETPERTFDTWASGAGAVVTVPMAGADASVRVRRHLALASGPWDCARQGCTLALNQGGNPVSNRVRVRFAPEWAPWPGPDRFLDEAVAAVAGRPVPGAERAPLKAALGARTTTGAQALVDAATTSRLDAQVGEVARLYRAFFGRRVDDGGLRYWLEEHRSRGRSLVEIARTFGRTPEFRGQYDHLDDASVVALVYQRTLGRSPASNEVAYWVGRLAGGLSRPDLVYSFARSPELRARLAPEVQGLLISWPLLGRVPTWGSPLEVAQQVLAEVTPPR